MNIYRYLPTTVLRKFEKCNLMKLCSQYIRNVLLRLNMYGTGTVPVLSFNHHCSICKLSMPVPTCLSWPCKKAKSTGIH